MSVLNNVLPFCVVLDLRINLWDELQKSFAEKGLNVYPCLVGSQKLPDMEYFHEDVPQNPPIYTTTNMYPSWVNKPNAYNAWLSHRKILIWAYQNKLDKVMILEDDVVLSEDFDTVLESVNEYFKDKHFDMLQFGGYHHNNTEQVADHVLKTKGSGGWHGVIIDKSIIPLLLSFQPIGPYDWICEQYIQPKYDCYCVYPGIVNQRDGHSFVEGQHLTKPDRFSLGV